MPERAALTDSAAERDVYDDGFLRVEHQRFYVAVAGQPFYGFTRKEFYILSRLARDFGRAVTTDEIWQYTWVAPGQCNQRTLRAHVSSLRRKLAPYGLDIVAIVHIGYRLVRCRTNAAQQ